MNGSRRLRGAAVAMILLGAVAAVGCEKGGNVRVNPTLYPPEVRYMSRSEVRAVMWQLRTEVVQLGQLLEPAEGEAVPAVEVAALLRRMDGLARRLDSPGQSSTEPLINQHIEGLRFDIRRALRGVSLEPPNYFWAESLEESCGKCHELKDRGPTMPARSRPAS